MNLITHSGTFHPDEVVAYSILKALYPENKLIRTREDSILNAPPEPSIVFDVGVVYNDAQKKYDHHQKGGAGLRPNGVPYAAAGLVWKHYGKAFLEKLAADRKLPSFDIDKAHQGIDRSLIQSVDAVDCGASTQSFHLSGKPEVHLSEQSLFTYIANFNPVPLIDSDEPEAVTAKFLKAVAAVEPHLISTSLRYISQQLSQDFLKNSDNGSPVLVLDKFVAWQEYAFKNKHLLYVVFPSDGQWKCQTVPEAPKSFVSRKPLPQAWAGLNGSDFAAATGLPDAVFCVNQRFICGTKSKESILQLAELAVKEIEEPLEIDR